MPLQQFDERIPFTQSLQFNSGATAGALVQFIEALGGTQRIDDVSIINTDVSGHVVTLYLGSTADTQWLSVTVPAGAGAGGVSPVFPFALLPAAVQYLVLSPEYQFRLYAAIDAAPAGASQVVLIARGGYC